jgi:hypothetical protein
MTRAKEAAGDKNVLVHGAGTAQLALAAGVSAGTRSWMSLCSHDARRACRLPASFVSDRPARVRQ